MCALGVTVKSRCGIDKREIVIKIIDNYLTCLMSASYALYPTPYAKSMQPSSQPGGVGRVGYSPQCAFTMTLRSMSVCTCVCVSLSVLLCLLS